MRAIILAGALGAAITTAATARPPEGADPALEPFYRSLTVPEGNDAFSGVECCSVADCRPVQIRQRGEHWQAFISAAVFPADQHPPDDWVNVPDSVIIRNVFNEQGEPVACWYGGRVRCFLLGPET